MECFGSSKLKSANLFSVKRVESKCHVSVWHSLLVIGSFSPKKYLYWHSKAVSQTLVPANTNTHIHTLHEEDWSVFRLNLLLSSFTFFIGTTSLLVVFLSALSCLTWWQKPADPRKKPSAHPPCPPRSEVSFHLFVRPADLRTLIYTESNFKHKSSFVSKINNMSAVFFFGKRRRRRRRVYNSPNIRNKTTARWPLYIK